MPSRFFYWRTPDGCLEKHEQCEGIAGNLFQPSTAQPQENVFTKDMSEYDPWLQGRDTSEVLSPNMDSYSTQAIDMISETMRLDDAPLEQDVMRSEPMLESVQSDRFEPPRRHPNQGPEQRPYSHHSLSLSEISELQDIAMPHYALLHKTKAEEAESRESSENDMGAAQSKKRKSSTGSEDSEAVDVRQKRKQQQQQQGHNAIEKRYRSNLNDKIYALRQRVPNLRTITEGVQTQTQTQTHGDGDGDAAEGPVPDCAAHKYGKAEILTGAVAYINHLEGTVERLSGEVVLLKTRVVAFERLAMSNSSLMRQSEPRALVAESLQTVQADFDYVNGRNIKAPMKQLRASRKPRNGGI